MIADYLLHPPGINHETIHKDNPVSHNTFDWFSENVKNTFKCQINNRIIIWLVGGYLDFESLSLFEHPALWVCKFMFFES